MNIGTPRNLTCQLMEMCLAMVFGMLVVAVLAGAALSAVGTTTSELENDAPTLVLVGMASSTTAPVVWWMRHRGHRWPACGEMAAAMFLPTIAAVALLAGGLVDDVDVLLGIQHAAMLPAMLGVMLVHHREHGWDARHRRPTGQQTPAAGTEQLS